MQGDSAREQWRSRTGFLMAAIGSAVGLGNIWRFSYVSYKNGGGAFLIPYLVALLTAGIPLMILEFALGHKMKGSAPYSLRQVSRHWEWLGWWSVIFVMFGIVLYYCVVLSWCVNYLFKSFSLAWGSDPNDYFFNQFLQISDGPMQIGGVQPFIVLALMAVWIVNWVIAYKGVSRGIELANRIFMPMLLVLTTVLVVWSFTFKGAGAGLAAYLTPDFSRLLDIEVWVDAYSQIFFSLSLGFGIMIAYASYLPEKTDLRSNAVITACADASYALFAGLAVFATLGYMAQDSGKAIGDVVTESLGLAFVAYPQAISKVPHLGSLFGAIFFISLIVAGLSSSVSILEAFASSIMDKFKIGRGTSVTLLCVGGCLGGIIFTTRGGLFWLDIVDQFLNHYGLVTVGLLECVLVGWVYKADTLRDHINAHSRVKVGPVWNFLIKIFIPAVLAIIATLDIIKEIRAPYGGYSRSAVLFIGLDWLVVTLVAAFFVSLRPWRKMKRSSTR